jgi:hypothetical protein
LPAVQLSGTVSIQGSEAAEALTSTTNASASLRELLLLPAPLNGNAAAVWWRCTLLAPPPGVLWGWSAHLRACVCAHGLSAEGGRVAVAGPLLPPPPLLLLR